MAVFPPSGFSPSGAQGTCRDARLDGSADVSARPRFQRLIRPNRSISGMAAAILFASYVAMMLGIGIGFWAFGAWMILPFMGLEVGVVAAVVYLLSRHREDYELLIVDDSTVRVLRRRGDTETRTEFQRYWAQVTLDTDRDGWYPTRLFIRSHGRETEIAEYMSDEAKRDLARELTTIVRSAR